MPTPHPNPDPNPNPTPKGNPSPHLPLGPARLTLLPLSQAPAMHCAPLRKYVVWKGGLDAALKKAQRPARIA